VGVRAQALCIESVGELLPHPALHSTRALAQARARARPTTRGRSMRLHAPRACPDARACCGGCASMARARNAWALSVHVLHCAPFGALACVPRCAYRGAAFFGPAAATPSWHTRPCAAPAAPRRFPAQFKLWHAHVARAYTCAPPSLFYAARAAPRADAPTRATPACLHHHSAARLRAQDKLVLIVFDRRSGTPVMFHCAFKAAYTHALVLHLGLVVVAPAHQGRHLQRLCMLNMLCACLTYFSPRYIMTDIAASPSATKQVGDNMRDCFPNYRHNCAPEAGGGPAPWQLAVARFMLDYHRADFGTSAEAVLDEATFVVRGSNAGAGGAAALMAHADKRRSRASRPNAFVEALLGPAGACGPDELFHVGHASASALLFSQLLRASPAVRMAVMAAHCATLLPAVIPAALGRPDACLSRFRAFAARTRLTIQIAGAPAVTPGGVLWVANHYSWLDYPVLQCASARLLRVVARADMGREGPFGAAAQRILRHTGVIEYTRGDKASGAAVRHALQGALTTDASAVLLFPEGTSQVEGPPMPFRDGGLRVAYAAGAPVQPVALRYSEPIGLAPETDALAGTAVMLTHSTQALVKFAPLVWPADYASADDFAAACEGAVRRAYEETAGPQAAEEPAAADKERAAGARCAAPAGARTKAE
jgi:1-acyl-sn-glycerol-3-phosphate acyltransferase